MTPIVSEHDLNVVRSLPHAVIFFWVNWSIHAIQSRTVVNQAKPLDQTLPSPLPYFVADVNDQSGDLWDALREWLRAEDAAIEHAMWAGSGALLWLRSGGVVHQLVDPMNYTAVEVAAISKRVFASTG